MDISNHSTNTKQNENVVAVDIVSEKKRLEEKLRKEKMGRSNVFKQELANCTKKKNIVAFVISFVPTIFVLLVGLLTGVTSDGFPEALTFSAICSSIIFLIVRKILSVVMSVKVKKHLGFDKNGNFI